MAPSARKTAEIARASRTSDSQRIVLVTPHARGELPVHKESGFSGYLIKPIRAASLAARFEDERGNIDDVEPCLPARSHHTQEGLSILVAEDNESNALLARVLLERLGHRPVMVGNGALAIESFAAAHKAGTPYDLVLMDVHMPEVDGMSATRTIRMQESAAHAARTPIFALTATVTSDDREACHAAGMDGFLTKPLDREHLLKVLAGLKKAAIAA